MGLSLFSMLSLTVHGDDAYRDVFYEALEKSKLWKKIKGSKVDTTWIGDSGETFHEKRSDGKWYFKESKVQDNFARLLRNIDSDQKVNIDALIQNGAKRWIEVEISGFAGNPDIQIHVRKHF